MSGNRFHNKFHKTNHHTDATPGDIDSATDPIASPSDPFKGEFNLSGDLVMVGGHMIQASDINASGITVDEIAVNGIGSQSGDITIYDDIDLNGNDLIGSTLDTLGDVETIGKTLNDVLKWDGSKWTNANVPIAENEIGMYEIDETIFGVGLTVDSGKVNSTSTTPVGGMIMWMADALPTGWLECNGQGLSIASYTELYAVIGDIYGVDANPGATVFYMPDMRGMFPRGVDSPARGGSYGDPDGGSRASSTVDGVDGSNVKTGRNVGTKQDDADQRVEGSVFAVDEGFPGNPAHLTGCFGPEAGSSRWGTPGRPDTSGAGSFKFDNNNVIRTSTETRPNNVYVKFIMKVEP